MVSEDALREACRREHVAIMRCYWEWDREGRCTSALQDELAHHSVVLWVLRQYLERKYHQHPHGG